MRNKEKNNGEESYSAVYNIVFYDLIDKIAICLNMFAHGTFSTIKYLVALLTGA